MTLPAHRTVGDYEKLEARVAKLRQILVDCCFAVGGAASADVSDEFLGGLPTEVTALAKRCAVNLRDLLAERRANEQLRETVAAFCRTAEEVMKKS